jgi:carbamoyltransferase
MKIILGISAFYHDSAAAILVNGQIVASAEEERFSRIKHDNAFPLNAIKFCLDQLNIGLADLDHIVFYDKPFLKFERILETAYSHAPKGFGLFYEAIPQWLGQKLNLRKTIQRSLKDYYPEIKLNPEKILFTEHHMAHAASAFFPSPFDEAAILIVDGVGEWATLTLAKGKGSKIEFIKQQNFPHSLGLLYSSFTYFLGFEVNEGEYKVMGLSPYGDAESAQFAKFKNIITTQLIHIFDDGSIRLNMDFFNFTFRKRMIEASKWESLFGIPMRKKKDEISIAHANLALAIQRVTEEVLLLLARTIKSLTACEQLVMAGGVALNAVANGKLLKSGVFNQIWIQPAAADSGGALGAALAAHQTLYASDSTLKSANEMRFGFLGPEIKNDEILPHLNYETCDVVYHADRASLIHKVAALISQDKILGWVQGRMELGARALGGRSIIASPNKKEIQIRINNKIKFREDFRPFAPVMLKEEAQRYYDFKQPAEYMQFVAQIIPSERLPQPENARMLSIHEQMKIPTSKFEAVTHVDYSSRLQVIDDVKHPFYDLLTKVKETSGVGMLLNTSLNMAGQPIVNSAKDIFELFYSTDLDGLAIGNYIIVKKMNA